MASRDIPAVKPWSLVPILCIFLGLISAVALTFFVKYLDKKGNNKGINYLIFIYGLIFLSLEIYHEVKRYLLFGFYDFSSFPFQSCSMPIYLCLILPFIKNQKVRDAIFYYFGLYGVISGIFPLLFGQAQLCRWGQVMDTIRSFVWHILILHLSIISIVHCKINYDIKLTYKKLIGSVVFFVGLTVLAQFMNVILHYGAGGINYPTTDGSLIKHVGNTLLSDPDSASCFYISPYFVSNMPVYSYFWKTLGWFPNYLIYISSFSLLAVINYFLLYVINKLFKKLRKN